MFSVGVYVQLQYTFFTTGPDIIIDLLRPDRNNDLYHHHHHHQSARRKLGTWELGTYSTLQWCQWCKSNQIMIDWSGNHWQSDSFTFSYSWFCWFVESGVFSLFCFWTIRHRPQARHSRPFWTMTLTIPDQLAANNRTSVQVSLR